MDRELAWLFGGVLAVLVAASVVGLFLRATVRSEGGRATVANLNARIWSWWVMSAVFAGALLTGPLGAVILFALVSFFAFREFITLTTSRPPITARSSTASSSASRSSTTWWPSSGMGSSAC